MKTANKTIFLTTKKQFEIVDITAQVKTAVVEAGVQNGIVALVCPHTTAAVKINQNEPLLMQDVMKTLYRLVPVDQSYAHDLFEVRQNVAPGERSNGHAHVKSFLLSSSETLVVEKGQIALGPRQSVFFVELDGGRERRVLLNILGE